MTNPKLDDLIARITATTGPDRVLDAEIAVAVGWTRHQDYAANWWVPPGGGFPNEKMHAPAFTASVEVAMTLIPDDLWWILGKGRTRPNEPLYGVQLRNPSGPDAVAAEAEHPTSIALAICLAALKLRSA